MIGAGDGRKVVFGKKEKVVAGSHEVADGQRNDGKIIKKTPIRKRRNRIGVGEVAIPVTDAEKSFRANSKGKGKGAPCTIRRPF